jgi:hypothetical protein
MVNIIHRTLNLFFQNQFFFIMNYLTLPEIIWSYKYKELQAALETELQLASTSIQDLQTFRDKEEKTLNQWATLLDFFWQSVEGTKQQLHLHTPATKEFISLDIYLTRLQNAINFYSSAIEIRKAILRKCDVLLQTLPVLRITFEKRIQSKNIVKDSQNYFTEYVEERKIQILKSGDRIVSEWKYLYDIRTYKV